MTEQEIDRICILLLHQRHLNNFSGQYEGPLWRDLEIPDREELRATVRLILSGDHPTLEAHGDGTGDLITLPESQYIEVD